jgi:hypothetical protein
MTESLQALASPRQLAVREHRTTYVLGVPCPKGHNGPRYTLNGACVECQRAWSREERARIRAQRGAA